MFCLGATPRFHHVKTFTQKYYAPGVPRPDFIPFTFNPDTITYTINERPEDAPERPPTRWPLLRAYTHAFGTWESIEAALPAAAPSAYDVHQLTKLLFDVDDEREEEGRDDDGSGIDGAAVPSAAELSEPFSSGISPMYRYTSF